MGPEPPASLGALQRDLVERWFKELTDKKLRRSSLTSVDQLIDTIDHWAEH